jgi:flagellar protein FlbD
MEMIVVTRLNGPAFALNPDLIERAESTPDTVITLVDGTKLIIVEPLVDLVELVRRYRASVIARAQAMAAHPSFGSDRSETPSADASGANVVPLRRRDP